MKSKRLAEFYYIGPSNLAKIIVRSLDKDRRR